MNRPRATKRYRSLSTRLFVLFIIAAVLPLSVSGTFGLASNYASQRRQVEALQQEIAANTANEIDAYLEQIEAEMALTARKWTFGTEASARLLLQTLLTFDHGFETLTLVDRAGQEVAKVSRYILFVPQDLVSRANSPDFLAAIEGQRYLGPVSLSHFEEPLVTLAIPVNDTRNDVVGVLVAEVNLKSMWDIVAQVKIGTGGYAYVVSGEGRLIAHRDASEVLQGQHLGQLTGVRQALQGQATTSWYSGLEGTDVIGSYQPLERANWFVLVESPRREALATILQTGALNVGALAATLGLAALLGGYIARNVVRPVRRLQEGATLIGGGDLAHRIDISSRDEIGDLAAAFNGMAARLWQTLKGLEQHVIELKRTEVALRESEARLRTIIDQIPFDLWVCDDQGRYIMQNAISLELGGNIIGKTIDDLDVPPEIRTEYKKTHVLALSGQFVRQEMETLIKGQQRVLDSIQCPIRDGDQIIGFIGMQIDITERKQLIADLEAKNAELEQFTYTVSHDLKTPLITIKGFLGLLAQDAASGDAARLEHDIKTISTAADKMQQLLNDLLELSRIGQLTNPPEQISTADLARQAVDTVAGMLSERGVQVSIAPDMPVVVGDRIRLRELFENLISNAAKFMGDQPTPCIEIGMRDDGEEKVLYVRDNGLGIDPRYHDTIFGLFEKLDPHGEGTGIGLAIVQRIVETHGGRIWVESEGQGYGSSFCFTLPQASNIS